MEINWNDREEVLALGQYLARMDKKEEVENIKLTPPRPDLLDEEEIDVAGREEKIEE